jgi:hypothetical protein
MHVRTRYGELFFRLRWDWVGFLVRQGAKHRHTIFHARVGPVLILQKVHQDTLRRTSIFTSIGICGSCRAFRCIRVVKHRRTLFHARVGPLRIQQKSRWDTLCQKSIFASGGICRSHSAFWCVQGVKHRCTIFHALVGP